MLEMPQSQQIHKLRKQNSMVVDVQLFTETVWQIKQAIVKLRQSILMDKLKQFENLLIKNCKWKRFQGEQRSIIKNDGGQIQWIVNNTCFLVYNQQMKLWVLPHVFKALVGYWSKLTSKSDTLSLKPSLSTDNVPKPLPKQSTQKKGKILKINLSEIPSQSESSNSQLAPKSKRIHKKSKQAIQNKDKKKIQWLENQVKTDCRFMDGSGEEISSIGERDGTDSELTVQDLMGELDPSFQQGRVNVEQLSINIAEHPSNFVKHTVNNTRLFKKKLNSQLVNDSKNNSPLRKALMMPVSRSQKKNAEKSRKEPENSQINCIQKREV